MAEVAQFSLERQFKAPKELVWKAWSDPELVSRWFGPNIETVIHKFDFTQGGEWLNEMKMGERSMLSKAIFREIVPGERLVFDQSNTDGDWNIVPSPMMPDWPTTISNVVEFRDSGSDTDLSFVWAPLNPTDAERTCFETAGPNMGKGWDAGFGIMDEILRELQG